MSEFPESGSPVQPDHPVQPDPSAPSDPSAPYDRPASSDRPDRPDRPRPSDRPGPPGTGSDDGDRAGHGDRAASRDGGPDRAVRGPRAEIPTVDQLQERLAEFAAARQWGRYHTPKNLAAALSVEAGELVEIFQWLTPEESLRVMSDPESAGRVRDEVADVLAYLLQFCEVLGVDALAALAAKIERNEKRFPVTGNGHSME